MDKLSVLDGASLSWVGRLCDTEASRLRLHMFPEFELLGQLKDQRDAGRGNGLLFFREFKLHFRAINSGLGETGRLVDSFVEFTLAFTGLLPWFLFTRNPFLR